MNKFSKNFIFLLTIIFLSSLAFSFENNANISQEAREKVRSKLSSFQKCYTDELKVSPLIEGEVVLNWEYSDQGKVLVVKIGSTTLNNKNVETCLISVIKNIKFPHAPKGQVAKVSYPFVFKNN